MTGPGYIYDALLRERDSAIGVHVAFASKSSMFVKYLNGYRPLSGMNFEGLTLVMDQKELELGKCLFSSSNTNPSFDGRLLFTDDVYNFNDIMVNGSVSNLETHFQKLPVILTQKSKVRANFVAYTANLIYDLNAYRSFFDQLDQEYSPEPPEVYSRIQSIVIEKEGPGFRRFFNERLEKLEALVGNFSADENQSHGYYFRRQIWPFISSSEFLMRTNLKPQGYAGDFRTITMVYENEYIGGSIFSRLMHKHPIETEAAQAVRSRRKVIKRELAEIVRRKKGKQKTHIVSIACGPVCEVEDILTSPEDADEYRFTLLDQDPDALSAAEANLARRERELRVTADYKLLNESVRTLLRYDDLDERIGSATFIYSLGLYDYLTDRIAVALTRSLYELLQPGGTLMLGNFHTRNPTRVYMEYWMDWVLYYRDTTEFLQMAAGLPASRAEIKFDETGCHMFLIIHKNI
jgi:extracellular factor (EF) 3-hydroxypalmitic acid methyl ester biosynthesis protein